VTQLREQVFAHRVERGLAGVFDEHRIAWLYEPHTFALEPAHDGAVTRAFTPDFFLPEIGIYVECTVARRALMTRKRQKGARGRAALRNRHRDRRPNRLREHGAALGTPRTRSRTRTGRRRTQKRSNVTTVPAHVKANGR
jgi:hypothetical protein